MRFSRSVLAVAACLLLSMPAFAQVTTADLTGTVTMDGGPLPGVSVRISSPALQGTRTTVTGEGGSYNLPGIPPGRYTVIFELEGMQTVTRTVNIGVAQTGRVDASMRLAAVAEAITVTAAAPSVLETPQVSSHVPHALVDNLPIARTVFQAAMLSPGVNDNTVSGAQFSISGSPGYDNLVMVNGVVVTEAVRSQMLQLYIEDAVQETTVLTGAISAEFGRFTGGVVNAITKSGGNEFSGSFRDSFSNPAWTAKTPWPTQPDPTEELGQVYEATLGGYIMRDRLWFFTAGRLAETSNDLFTRPVPGDPNRTTTRFVSTNENTKYEVKLTGSITSSHNLVGSYYNEDSSSTNTRFTSASYDLDSLSNRSDPKELLGLFYNGILSQNLLVEGRYSQMEYGIGHGSGSQFTDPIRGTLMLNLGDSSARFNSPTFCGVCDREWRNNEGWVAKANYFLSTRSIGTHNLVAGVEQFSEMRYANNHQSGSGFRVFVNDVQWVDGTIYPTINPGDRAPAALIRWTPIFESALFSNLETQSLFVNDRWDLSPNLSFNIGARFDKNDTVDASGNKTSDDS
ncbi:MAG TPA: carboxypeptidase regulatory-like domain-containing protein, partial [Thermoanaerobaculia bacterium]|nr:carboxypeptidase regulatory-like domain-containing protein [Thermoanaerobaculia bacterium]